MKNVLFVFFLIFYKTGFCGVYGVDDRIFIMDIKDEKIKRLSQSVGAMIPKEKLDLRGNNDRVQIKWSNDLQYHCKDNKFSRVPSLSTCTGFLIAPDKILTAGHCVFTEDHCKENIWTFNWNKGTQFFNKKNIYECQKIISWSMGEHFYHRDFSIIQLKNKVIGVAPLKLNLDSNILRNEGVFVIGHPIGLPKVLSPSATVTGLTPEQVNKDFMSLTKQSDYFFIDSDTFGGNSGSPVFNSKTYKVEGMLIEGSEDFILDEEKKCMTVRKENVSKWSKKEKIFRMNALFRILNFKGIRIFESGN